MVWRLISHNAHGVRIDVWLTDIMAQDYKDVGFIGRLTTGKRGREKKINRA